MSDIAEAVGKRIYAIRTSKHMSRKDLALGFILPISVSLSAVNEMRR